VHRGFSRDALPNEKGRRFPGGLRSFWMDQIESVTFSRFLYLFTDFLDVLADAGDRVARTHEQGSEDEQHQHGN
jgi:hypothetical protein